MGAARPYAGRWSAQHAKQRAIGEQNRAQLAELVSEGYSVAAAGRTIGVSQQRSSQLWAQVRDELGWQAQ